MKHRTWIGLSVIASLGIAVAASAPAQDRRERLREMLQKPRQPSDPAETRITAAGTYRFSFVHDGLTRQYIVYVPASVPRGRPAPMLLGLHGGGGNMDYQANNYGLKAKADLAGFVAVFPNGYSRFLNGILATWNAGTCCGRAAGNTVDDVGFLKDVIERVSRQMPIDRGRIYATGMSNGAMMSYRLACELPTLIRAIAPVAGTDNTTACTPSRPVPVILFHARDDNHVSFNGGAGKDALAKVDFTSVPPPSPNGSRSTAPIRHQGESSRYPARPATFTPQPPAAHRSKRASPTAAATAGPARPASAPTRIPARRSTPMI